MIEDFNRALDAIYEAALEPNLWPLALQAVANCFGDVGAVLVWRRGDEGFVTISSPSLTAMQKDYDEKWRWQDIRAARYAEHSFLSNGSGGMTDLDVMSEEEIETLPFYTEFLAPYGLCWSAVSFFVPDPEIAAGLGVLRAKGKPPYSRDELDLLEKLARHFERSLRLSMRLFEAEHSNLGMREVLNRLGVGVLALDREFGVVFANSVAKRGSLVVLDGDAAAPILTLAARQRIERALSQASAHDGLPTSVLLEQGAAGSPLTMHVLPVTHASAAAHDLLARAQVLVLVSDSRGDAPPDPALVRDVLSLTLGEARVAALVGSGLSPKTAADQLGIAESTARTVLKRVFAKTGVSRQSELVALFGRKSLH